MKVGTDGVLLGAWAGAITVHEPSRILDIGTGSGVIALMMAQRFPTAVVDAVELDPSAAQQSMENFAGSPWPSRLHLWQGDFRHVSAVLSGPYDLIVCNPPYFSKGWPVEDDARHKARVAEQLPQELLLQQVKKIIQPNGALAVVLPTLESEHFTEQALQQGWRLSRRTDVRTRMDKPVKRVLTEWVPHTVSAHCSELVIHPTNGEGYTDEYKRLTREFYLAF